MTRLDDSELARLAAQTVAPPSLARVQAVRAALLDAAVDTRQRRRSPGVPSWIVSVAAVVLAAVAVVLWWDVGVPPVDRPSLASITASGAATFERRQSEDAEAVHLFDGEIRLDVVPLSPQQTFRVVAPDAEVVVRGASFTVVVRDDELRRVRVVSGRVEIRRDANGVLTLMAGETWSRDRVARAPVLPQQIASEPAPIAPRVLEPRRAPPTKPSAVASSVPSDAPPKAAVVVDPSEVAFQDAWTMFQDGSFAEAAAAFARADVADSPVREEAQYWRAVALMRAQKLAAADRAFAEFLEANPRATKSDEAALLLGRLRVLGGDHAGARPWLERAARSERPSVKSRAEGLLRASEAQ